MEAGRSNPKHFRSPRCTKTQILSIIIGFLCSARPGGFCCGRALPTVALPPLRMPPLLKSLEGWLQVSGFRVWCSGYIICAEMESESFVILEKRRPLTCRAKPIPCQRFCRMRHNGLSNAFTIHVFPKLDIPVLPYKTRNIYNLSQT